jgi:hypothetical protein
VNHFDEMWEALKSTKLFLHNINENESILGIHINAILSKIEAGE